MAIAIGGHAVANDTFDTTTTTGGVTTQASGSTFVICVQSTRAGDPIHVSSITDNKGNTYTLRTSDNPGYNGDILLAAYTCVNGTGGAGHTATVLFDEQSTHNIFFIEITGADTTAPADGVAATSGGGSAGTSWAGIAVTTTNANDLILSFAGSYGFDTGTITLSANTGAGWAILDSIVVGTVSRHAASSYIVKSSTGSYADTYTASTTDGFSALTLAFKAASGGGGGSAALTGQSSTFSAGTAAVSHSQALTGQAATFAAGTVGAGGNVTTALTGQSATLTAGTAVATPTVALIGTAITSAVGSVTQSHAAAVSGQAATFASGLLTQSTAVLLVGQRATAANGTVSTGSDVTTSLTGQSSTLTAGSLVAASQTAVTGKSAAFAAGTLSFSASLALLGQPGAFAPGTVVQSHAIGLTGQSGIFTSGIVAPPGGITLSLTGQVSTFASGVLAPSAAVGLSGRSIASAPGSVLSGITVGLTGRGVLCTTGLLTPWITAGVAGQGSIFTAGFAVPLGDVVIQLTGSRATFANGTLIPGHYLTGEARYIVQRFRARRFEVQAPVRQFEVSAVSYLQFEPKGPDEKIKLTFDFTPDLTGTAVTLAGSPTVTISMEKGADANPTALFNGAAGFDITGQKVIVPVQAGIVACDYAIRVNCATTDSQIVLGLTGILPVRLP